ncbi:hypothetical protein [Enterocloster sp.]
MRLTRIHPPDLDDLIQAAKADSGSHPGNAGATATTGVVAYGLNNAPNHL